MTTCRDIIKRALQLSRIVALGRDPRAGESDLGMEVMQSMYDDWVNAGMFGSLSDRIVTADTTALEGERIRFPSTATITYPTSYRDDGQAGGDRPPFDLSLIETFNTTTSERSVKLWDRNQWVELTGLTLNSNAPLASRGSIGLASCVALLLAETFGDGVPAHVQRQAATFRQALTYKLGADRPARTAEYY